jgi:prolyl-tRNA synthetase
LVRADFVDQLSSGIYSLMPLGWRVHKNIEQIIRQEINAIGAQELMMPVLQPKRLLQATGHWSGFGSLLFKTKDRAGRIFGLSPTHEGVITNLVKKRVSSYKELPLALYQIQIKFRNEMRATGGLLRTREFIMKDLYSFHSSQKDLNIFYEKVKGAYSRIFKRCGLSVKIVEAEGGAIGGQKSHEFMFLAQSGEDKIVLCSSCGYGVNFELVGAIKSCPDCGSGVEIKRAIEGSHVFDLGVKYSEAMKAVFRTKDGKQNFMIMGCYGIGLGRLMAAIVESSYDKQGIIWPDEVAPYQVHLLGLGEEEPEVQKRARVFYKQLKSQGIEVLYDDRRDAGSGEKLVEADLIGIPWRVVVSEKTVTRGRLEIKRRDEKKVRLVTEKELFKLLT